jgi:rhodanese-related sulfurtransferase
MHEYVAFAGRHWYLLVALVIILTAIAFEEIRRTRVGARELDPAAAVQIMNRGALVLDCRQSEDFGKGHIVGARNLPLARLDDQARRLKTRRNRPVLAVGATPGEASRAAGELRRAGFEAVYVIKGGLSAWSKQNLPLEQGQSAPPAVKSQKKKRGKK